MNSTEEEISWIQCFCEKTENAFFVQVDELYIREQFNLTGLRGQVCHYKEALYMILDIEEPKYELKGNSNEVNAVEKSAESLYGLIHARYILTDSGIGKMNEKYKQGTFGCCPKVYCENQHMLPTGISDMPEEDTVKLYCPKCMDIFHPMYSIHNQIDGAYFGTNFPHMFFMVHPEFRPKPPSKKLVLQRIIQGDKHDIQ